MPENIWEEFFDNHAPEYSKNEFTSATIAEVDFIESHLNLIPGMSILDIGCGIGRHAVELAQRGYLVTGIDLSAGMLDQARMNAENAGVELELLKADATRYSSDSSFDIAICLCEGGFGLIGESDDPLTHDNLILANIFKSLKPGGRFVLTALNAMKMIRQYSYDVIKAGVFDTLRKTESTKIEINTPKGLMNYRVTEHSFMPGELGRMFREIGFIVKNIWGGTAGNWNPRPIDPDEYEIMVIARKPDRQE